MSAFAWLRALQHLPVRTHHGLVVAACSMLVWVVYQATASPSSTAHAAVTAAHQEPLTFAPSAIVINDNPSYRVVGNTMQFFFESGKAELHPAAREGLVELAQQLSNGQRIQVAGIHDNTGSVKFKQKIANQRAAAIKHALLGLGVKEQQVLLRPPGVIAPMGNVAMVRRAEVTLLQ